MEPLYVNPEALGSLAHPYYAAGEHYQHIGEGYNELLPKFREGFGDDDTGRTFYQHFIKGAEELGLRVKNLEDAMVYCGDGLTHTSELYGQAEDDATQTALGFRKDTDEILAQPVHEARPLLQPAVAYQRTVVTSVRPDEEPEQGEAQPLQSAVLYRRTVVETVHPDDPPLLKRRAVRSVRPGEGDGEQGQALLQPAEMRLRTPLLPDAPIGPDGPTSGFFVGEVIHVEARKGDDDPNPIVWTEARFMEGHGLPPDGFRPGSIPPDERNPGVAPNP